MHADRSRLREQIAEVLKSMKNMFSDLTKKQSDALTRPLDKLLNSNLIIYLSMFLGCEIPTEAVLGLHPSHVCRCDEAGPHHEQLHCEVEDSCLQEHGLMLQPYLNMQCILKASAPSISPGTVHPDPQPTDP